MPVDCEECKWIYEYHLKYLNCRERYEDIGSSAKWDSGAL